ncbi:peptidase A4 family-domain-containing protein [Mycena haematopus]|nr:peptidase A4 family-domain-containing protein [Mycena haematopus]
MFFATSLLSYALLATTAFAAPRGTGLQERISRRREARMSSPRRPAEGITNLVSNTTTEVSSNWAGAAFVSAAGTYKSVTGTFVVPTPQASSSSSYGSASAWVGIDGDTCGTAILQTGIDFTVFFGQASFQAWYEYYPAGATDFSGIKISAGNTIKLTVTATSTTSGTATIENVSTGVTVSKSLTSTAELCLENAEWIVEDYEDDGSQVPFANFGTVAFTEASATTQSGSTVGPSDAVLITMQQNNQVLTSVSTGSSSVTVSYV